MTTLFRSTVDRTRQYSPIIIAIGIAPSAACLLRGQEIIFDFVGVIFLKDSPKFIPSDPLQFFFYVIILAGPVFYFPFIFILFSPYSMGLGGLLEGGEGGFKGKSERT